MKVIPISGVIGWDVKPADIRKALQAAGSEEIEVQLSSPGGFVTEGLEIFNLLRRHTGRIVTRLMGMAASMASYLALAGRRVLAEENVVFMIHNAMGVALGDYRTMEKMRDILDGLSGILAQEYARKSGQGLTAIRTLMNDETWYFGEEAQKAGFVDEVVPAKEGEKDRAAALNRAKAAVAQAARIIGEHDSVDNLVKAAACAGLVLPQLRAPAVAAVVPATQPVKIDPFEIVAAIKGKRVPPLSPEALAACRKAGLRGSPEELARLAAASSDDLVREGRKPFDDYYRGKVAAQRR